MNLHMVSELTNLLPREKTKALRREYFIRLATVAVLILIAIVLVQIALLVPSYLYEREMVTSRTTELKRLSANLATTQEQEVQSQITSLTAESTYLLALNNAPTASAALRAILAVPRPGITISGFTYGLAGDGTSKTMQITGVAATREDLRA